MRIVIDVDKAIYKVIKETMQTTNRHLGKTMMLEHLMKVIDEGIPLPKGHGRLIDADALKVSKHPTIVEYQYINEFYPNEPVCEYTEYYRCDTIRNAPTIIEADKEAEE